MPEPTFLVCGGQRCGTTSVWNLLNQHPDIFMANPPRPEPKFFVNDHAADKQDYLDQWFSDTGEATAIGEKSTSYLETPGAAERIAAMFPNIRLVFVLRHPAERAISNYRFSVQNGLETRSLVNAMAGIDPPKFDRNSVCRVSPFDYIQRGKYADLLAPYEGCFDRRQLCILFLDDLQENPAKFVRGLYGFLEVDSKFTPPFASEKHNVSAESAPLADEETIQQLVEGFAESNRQLKSITGCYPKAWDRMTPQLKASIR